MQFFQNLVPSNSTLLLMVVAPAIFSNQPAFFAYQNFFIFHIKPPSQNKRYNLLPVLLAGNNTLQYSTQVGADILLWIYQHLAWVNPPKHFAFGRIGYATDSGGCRVFHCHHDGFYDQLPPWLYQL